jgi:transcription factor E2F7/8
VKPEKEEDKPPRKERSIGKVCENFMGLFADVPIDHNNGTVIEICEIASRLRVQRRRIYDVINILEAIDVVTRVKKNTYRWHGLEGLHAFFAKMQKDALAERSSATTAVAAATGGETGLGADDGMVLTPAESNASTGHKSKGMATICKKLLEMYLVSGRTEIGLAEAAEEILGALSPAEEADPENRAKVMRFMFRRMYDIANVLATLGILTKENVGSTSVSNKPSLRWVYPVAPGEFGNYIPPPPAPSMVAEMMETAAAAAALGNSLPDPIMARGWEFMNPGETLEV